MARSRHDPSMKHRWRAEDDPRDRDLNRSRESERHPGGHRPPSPSFGYSEDYRGPHRDRDQGTRGGRRQSRKWQRDTKKSGGRKPSLSPTRPANSKHSHAQHSRPFKDRPARIRDFSPDRHPKRRRTQSPSPAPSDRFGSDSRNPGRSRDRPDIHDRRSRSRSPFRPSNASRSDSGPRGYNSDVRGSRESSPHRRQDRRSISPRHSSRASPSRRDDYTSHRETSHKDFRPPKRPGKSRGRRFPVGGQPRSRTPSVVDDTDNRSMDGQHSTRGNYGNHRGQQRPFVDTRQQYNGSPPYSGTPNSSYHGSQAGSPYHNPRGGWGGGQSPHGPMYNSSPPYRQNNFPGPSSMNNPNPYYQNQQYYGSNSQGYQQPSYRGGHGPRGGQYGKQDQRFNGRGRGRGGHFNNLQWTAPPTGPKRGGSQNPDAQGGHMHQTSPVHSQDGRETPKEEGNVFRPSKDLQVEDQKHEDQHAQVNDQTGTAASKFSFAFKSKAPPSGPARQNADFSAKPKGPFHPDERGPPTQPRKKPFDRFDRFDRRDDRPNQRPLPPSFPSRPDRRALAQAADNRRPDRSRSPPSKKSRRETKSRPTLTPEFADSDSVYFRKPGNESVVGAGTYGKVFKAIHIYTKDKVALKKIRMEGERDGFPITAVREIRLLQHLRHKHVVALQEVMVEKNECFMVFEYMSHDLTGLINHPTFTLSPAHKKDLAKQMFEGLEFLHRRGVLHRDIKAANILVSNTGLLKYADFGLARFYTKSRKLDYTNRVITIWYRPPELILGETQYGPEVDIWSAACVFVEMFTKKAIFPGEGGELSQLEKVYNMLGTPTRAEWPGIIDLPWFELMQPADRRKRQFETIMRDIFTPAGLELVQWMFKYDPKKRPSADEVLKHAYFLNEEPKPEQAMELARVEGDWHEFESKAARRERDKQEKERRKEEQLREKEKRKAREADLPEPDGSEKKARLQVDAANTPVMPPPPPNGEVVGSAIQSEEVKNDDPDESEGEGSARMSMS
ncbi:uncharacterized protein PV06_01601 [Exophiala oligosperma]|uniref:cyclin-dependent kinase n=1 Tax=Exophiala oligosperma TaxID=215243 RepID=A0A0D2DTN7_9EURO|nr:uncharacterized protein PV06_01601 [Exophiala oligosperma]KIW45895.1 hypothetical protein PV06_01601 [Exophiala oligosperma]